MDTIANPVVGEVYMSRRIYNSKRMIQEPCRYLGLNRAAQPYWRYDVQWVMDGQHGGTTHFTEYKPKWTARKIADIQSEIETLKAHQTNLGNIHGT